MSDEMMFKVPEVAARLKVSTSTVWDLIWKGKLKHTRVGRLVRVGEWHLREFLNANEGAPPSLEVSARARAARRRMPATTPGSSIPGLGLREYVKALYSKKP